MEHTAQEELPFSFTELLELTEYSDGAKEWKEVMRWVKYEETVEDQGNRWSKPHVATPTLQSILHLRRLIKSGAVLLDLEETNLPKICSAVAEELVSQNQLSSEQAARFRDLCLLKHRHQFEGPRKVNTSLTSAIKDLLLKKLDGKGHHRHPSKSTSRSASLGLVGGEDPAEERESSEVQRPGFPEADGGQVNLRFMKKLPKNAEAAVVLVGCVGWLEGQVSALVRLHKPVVLMDLPEVDIPTRFLYIVVGPPTLQEEEEFSYTQLGRAAGAAFSDRLFTHQLLEADSKEDVVGVVDTFLDSIQTLPSDWNPRAYLEPPGGSDEKDRELEEEEEHVIDDDRRNREASGLVRSGRLFGGLINDIKRKAPHYISDFTDGFHPQCVSSFLFLYFACLAPIVAFGALQGEATDQRIATIEGLMAGLLSGVLFSLFSGQPLNLLGSTGPVYIFEKILFEMCRQNEWDYLSLRLWIGIWVAIMLLLLVAFDASAYVCYITRFTEELFASLVSFIFIMSAFQSTFHVKDEVKHLPCHCYLPDTTNLSSTPVMWDTDHYNTTQHEEHVDLDRVECLKADGALVGPGCDHGTDVYLMSLLLFFGTFLVATALKQFRFTGFFPAWVRSFLSDFAVIIGILAMTSFDFFSGLPTPKLDVPSEFKPTWDGRGWMVTHAWIFPEHALANPWWVDAFLAPLFALLATILIFMDQQITAVIVNRKEYKLKKGCGYHLDLLVLAVIILVSSIFGLPWFVANTVPSINHMQSLAKESTTSIPGEKPKFLGVREQRLTCLLIAILTGLSVFMTPILAVLPMPVLYGVFLFMGINSLRGLQFFDRMLLFLMPGKYQPNYVYLKYVPLSRIHLFTLVQMVSLGVLWVIKSIPTTSIGFPVMLVVICVIRKSVECIFTNMELRALDDLLPMSGQKSKRKIGIAEAADEENWDGVAERNHGTHHPQGLTILQHHNHKKQAGLALYETELEELMISDLRHRGPKPNHNRNVETFKTEDPGSPINRVVLFAKLETETAYSPLTLSPTTIASLTAALRQRFHQIHPLKIEKIIQKTKKGITFQLEDSVMDFSIKNYAAFIITLEQGESESWVVTLIEQSLE